MKRFISCAVTFCLAFSMMGIPSLAFAKDAVEEGNAQVSTQSTEADDQGSSSSAAEESSSDAIQFESSASSTSNPSSANVIEEIPDGDVVFFGVEDAEAQAEAKAIKSKGSQLSGSLVTIKLRSQIHPSTPTGNLTNDFGVIAQVIAANGTVIASAEFVPNVSVIALNEEQDVSHVIGDYVAKFTDRIPQGTYTLKISGKNYVPHVEDDFFVEDGNRVNVELVDMVNASTDSTSVSATVRNNGNIQGLLPYGDFNGDGRVDNNDTRMMTSALATAPTAEAISAYDINADGTFNLVDAQFFATTLKHGNNTASSVEELISVIHGKPVITKDTQLVKVTASEGCRVKVGADVIGEDDQSDDQLGNSRTSFDADAVLREALFENTDNSIILEQTVPVSEESPVSIEVSMPAAVDDGDDDTAVDNSVMVMGGLTIRPISDTKSDHSDGEVPSMRSGSITVVDEDDVAHEYIFKNGQQVGNGNTYDFIDAALRAGSEEANAATNDNPIVIDFGTRIAIKKIVIKVTETTQPNATLAEIGKVEFLNDMADRIDPPDLSIPTTFRGTPGNKQITFTWDPQTNITGYEICITAPETNKKTTSSTVLPTFSIADKKLQCGLYKAQVRSANGDWKSPWSEEIQVELVPTKRPDKPTGLKLTGGSREVIASWPAVEDATYYSLYYQAEGASQFSVVDKIVDNKYTIGNLKDETKYLVYLTASNSIGTSPNSEVYSCTTYGKISVKVPWYNLINRTAQYATGRTFKQGGKGQNLNTHIVDIQTTGPNDETLNPGFDPKWMVDGDYATGFIPKRASTYYDGANITFDKAYDMDHFVVTSTLLSSYIYTDVADMTLRLMNEDGAWTNYSVKAGNVKLSSLGSNAKGTFKVAFPKSSVKQLIFGSMRAYAWKAPVSEIAFYGYDDTADQIDAMWADDLHTVLKEQLDDGTVIDEKYLAQLEAEVNTVDPATIEVDETGVVLTNTGECSPNKSILLASIQSARDALAFKDATEPARIYSSIDNTTNANVGGINDWQPIGIAAYSGDKIQVFAGGRMNAGSQPLATNSGPTPMLLGIGQTGAETGNVYKQIGQLKYGANEFVVPETGNGIDALENGGQLYVRSVTANKNSEFNVRVLGGIEIACLNLYKVTNDDDYRAACEKYVDALNEQVANLEKTHNDRGHSERYTKQTCVANTTDIMLDSIMYSVPASQILASLGHKGDREGQIQQLINSTKSSSEMMNLFWQHKGLWKMTTAEQQKYGGKNGIPAGHLNPRFMRMNPGVFMYAAGNHIGVQYGSATFAGQPGVTSDENGKYISGRWFGWGVAHEIGHQINQGCYTYAEVTNNYYAQLEKGTESNNTTRWSYPSLYNRVTSGAKGAPTGKIGIGLYWQLHLAYDNGYNFKQYNSYTDIYNNLMMARIDSIARNPSAAPGTGFTLSGANKDNALMRLACAAAGDATTGYGRNILDFFVAWGQTPDATTIAYASQFEKDDRLLQYVNDEARLYRIDGGQSVGADTEVWADLYEGPASNVGNDSKKITESRVMNTRQVTLQMGVIGDKTDGLIGFEILRNGKAVGFKMVNGSEPITFTDTVVTENNRTYTYAVRAVDNLLATSKNTVTFPMVKFADRGAYADKSRWDANTNMISSADQGYDYTAPEEVSYADESSEFLEEPSSCENELQTKAVMAVIDGKADSGYTGTLPTGDKVPTNEEGTALAVSTPYVEVDFGATLQVTGITVPTDDSATVQGATIQVFDGTDWVNVAPGTGVPGNGEITYYFNRVDDPQLHIYNAAKMRIVAPEGSTGMAFHEIDVIGPTGDNADFLEGDGWVGYVDVDTTYAPEPEGYEGEYTIPANSLVFVGSYKGDTAYNALKFFKMTDEGQKLVGGTQVFFAEEPGEGRNLGVTADGRWIYYITPDDMHELGWTTPEEVYVELYRVDDAFTLENERLVASSLLMRLPSDIPTLHLNIKDPNNMGEPTVSE